MCLRSLLHFIGPDGGVLLEPPRLAVGDDKLQAAEAPVNSYRRPWSPTTVRMEFSSVQGAGFHLATHPDAPLATVAIE